uniref:Amine oxidase domain-containing protein n=1 Tax=Kalanchoe fedtschenkoi TaxID=63787 RepID=A0A7N0VM44_KALFE
MSLSLHPHPLPPVFRLRATLSPTTTATLSSSKPSVVIVGAGLAGLAAATRLNSANIPFLLLDAADAVGGRVRTDHHNGYTLDRGFQILITGYPEARTLLDYPSLHLRKFYSGAQVYFNGTFHTVADPVRHPSDSLQSLSNPIGSVADKLLIGVTRLTLLATSDEQIMTREEKTTIELLKSIGFSDSIVDKFFRPFFGGIFFDPELGTSSRLFDFIFKCLALGDNTLPASGISTIPNQLASNLPPESILLNSRVVGIDFNGDPPAVILQNGDVLRPELGVVIAIDELESEKLMGDAAVGRPKKRPVRSTVCLYFSAAQAQIPTRAPVLFLNGSGQGIINNMFFATNVAPSYAPEGQALVSVSLIGLYENVSDEDLVTRVTGELSEWFGGEIVRSWTHLRTYRIPYAQPNQCPPTDLRKNPRVRKGVYACGDHMTSATFNGAMVSGREAAEALLKDKASTRV